MLPRRHVLGGGLVALAGTAREDAKGSEKTRATAPHWFELRTIRLRQGTQPKLVNDFLSEVALPAWQRAGAGPVGVFEVTVGPQMPSLVLLIPHESPAALATMSDRLAADPAYHKGPAALAYHAATAAQPAYVRMESALLRAFEAMPHLVAPEKVKTRIFELRHYESATEAAHLRKVEMFARMGEIDIFKRDGLIPVFFASTVFGPSLPSLTYLLGFADFAAREKAWAAFRADPEWQKLRTTAGYTDAEIVSNITDELLRPTAYSQL
jgi:hypothetical protein